MDSTNLSPLSLAGQLTRGRALVQLLSQGQPAEQDAELCLMAGGVDQVDVVAATATRMRVQRHRRESPSGSATLWLPRRVDVARRYHGLLDPLPELTMDPEPSPEDAHPALLPATVVPDSGSALLAAEYTLDACRFARISRRRSQVAAAAVLELSDNALLHAPAAEDSPTVAVNSFGRERIVEVAVTDAGTGISDRADARGFLGSIPGSYLAGSTGFLAQIIHRGRKAGATVSVELLAGNAQLRWTESQHNTARVPYVPGLTVVMRIA